MIIIKAYGLDHFTIGHYSHEHLENLQSLFETKEEIVFIGSDAYVFYNGVDQNSWQAIVKVSAPEKYAPLEEKIANYLLKTLSSFAINIRITFKYFHGHSEHEFHNNEYPRFIARDNLVDIEESDEDEELYEGNIFEGMEKKLEEAYSEGHHCHCHDGEDDECCHGDCDCEHGDCDCEDGECCCEHHKH